MTRAKYPPRLSDSTLDALWRRVVLMRGDYKCRNCGVGGKLEAHHLIHRRYKLLKWDIRNGVPAHPGECHETINHIGLSAARPEDYTYLLERSKLTKKQYLLDHSLSEAEWRAGVRAELLKELGT